MRRLTLSLLARFGAPREAMVLDAGCGTGLFLRDAMSCFGSKRGIGVEYFLEPIRFAARRSKALLIGASADALPVRPGSVDIVHSADVLQHMTIAGARQAIREFHCVLRPGGLVALRLRATRRLAENPPDEDMNHAYTSETLREQLRDSGFEVLFLRRVNVLPSIAEELRQRGPRHHGDHAPVKGIALRDEGDLRATVLRTYLFCERLWLRAGFPTPEYGHTILAVARKR